MKLDFISSIWDNAHIERFDKNKWKYTCCDNIFQGIKANKDMSHVMIRKGIHINSCFIAI